MSGFLLRWLGAAALVFATYNPTQWNYTQWGLNNYATNLPVTVLAGLILLVGYIIYLRATFRSIGPVGIALVAAVIGAILWVLVDQGWLDTQNTTLMTWIGLAALSLVLAIGISWSLVRRTLTGQADMDDVDE